MSSGAVEAGTASSSISTGSCQAQLSIDEIEGFAGPTAQQRLVRDTLDAYVAIGVELEPRLAPEIRRRYRGR